MKVTSRASKARPQDAPRRQRPAAAADRRTGTRPTRDARRREPDAASRRQRPASAAPAAPPHEPRTRRRTSEPRRHPGRPATREQAKARTKARKAKAPKVVRPPLRERLAARIAAIDLRPRALVARIPFVVLVIGALGVGLGVTLWLSTDAAERSYQLGSAHELNEALSQQKEALERDVLAAQAPPALAEAARQLGMIPTRDTAHLVQDPAGAWIVVGTPKPAEGVPPPPLNTPVAAAEPAPPPRPERPPVEVPVLVAPGAAPAPGATPHGPAAGPEALVRLPEPALPGPVPPAVNAPVPPAAPAAPAPTAPAAPAAPAPPAPVGDAPGAAVAPQIAPAGEESAAVAAVVPGAPA
ncbi:hypothetical protein LV457_10540 [Mycobacterium sp. MYCO198283]|uniref:hypothetical protein n=1 Tax=Mycobacterium sp. MYCO198283 TaxID=2883505 RepID=UPI001E38057A|nr:hypothetical protein [Mycobacterium sp. MYCO198283]MCG5432724.1 hypothetical protein [Mycobacterium sp. MYCO198283]